MDQNKIKNQNLDLGYFTNPSDSAYVYSVNQGEFDMGFGEAIKTCFSKYFTFSGRARRSEYWWFYLFTILLGIAAGIIDALVGGVSEDIGIFGIIASLVTLIPSLAAQVRRLHDTGRSGWWIGGAIIAIIVFGILIGAVGATGVGSSSDVSGTFAIMIVIFAIAFFIYAIVMLVFLCQDSQDGNNKYGPNPKYDTTAEVFS